jgi:hypothetical protein
VIPSTPDEPATIVNESAAAKVEDFGENMQKNIHQQILRLTNYTKPIASRWFKKVLDSAKKISNEKPSKDN